MCASCWGYRGLDATWIDSKSANPPGHYYYEATVTDEGLARVGWSSKAAKLELGTCQHGFGYGGTAKKSHKKQFENYGEAYGLGDTIGCYLDATAGAIWFSKNGIIRVASFLLDQLACSIDRLID